MPRMELVLYIIVGLMLTAVGFIARPRGTSMDAAPVDAPGWEAFARHHGLDYHGGIAPTMTGQFRGHDVMVSTDSQVVQHRHGESYVVRTLFEVSVPALPDLWVAPRSGTPHDTTDRPSPDEMEKLAIAHPGFDRHYEVRGRDRAVERVSRRGVPEVFVELRDRGYQAELFKRELYVLREEYVRHPSELEALLNEVIDAADVLDGRAHPGSFSSDPQVRRWSWASERNLEYDQSARRIHGTMNGRAVEIHFGDRLPMTVVAATTTRDLGIRTRAPVSTVLAIPHAAIDEVHRVVDNGDEVHFVDVVRIRVDRPLEFDEIEQRLSAVLRAAELVDAA